MKIFGLQKLTLLDYPGKVACTVFTGGCNFRCPFCHNGQLVTGWEKQEPLEEEEIFRFLQKRKGILDGVCISGGEPLLQEDLPEFVKKLKGLGYSVKLDTNGSMPERLKYLAGQGLLDYVAMDIKNAPCKYGETIGCAGYDAGGVEESVRFLLKGELCYEFRTTVVREFHRREDFEEIGRWIRGAKSYYLQQFVDSGNLIGAGLHGYDREILEQALEVVKKYVEHAEIRGI